ncbi:MAG: quinolinate synthase NadA [bacterium]
MAIKTQPLEVRWNPEQPIEDVKYMGEPVVAPAVLAEILEIRKRLGRDLVLLGHYYQRDEVIQFADKTGDSLVLAQYASEVKDAKYVIFLGVHFMAETADMLTPDSVKVILPDKRAGCTMADMAQIGDIEEAWEQLGEVIDTSKLVPVTYINSTADVKAFVGRHGGTICTSSNAHKIITWALEKGERLFFFPDQHLGRNTSYELGIPLDKMVVWNPEEPLGGNSAVAIRNARVLLWQGHCSVHQHFIPEHVDAWRKRIPDIKIIVHPECSFEVVQKADNSGSTSKIIKTIAESPEGSKWAVGTENHLVARIGQEMVKQGKEVYSLAPYACLCSTMFRISPEALLESLRAVEKGELRWHVAVDPETTRESNAALERMFDITRSGNAALVD